jgi:hypothetical protein
MLFDSDINHLISSKRGVREMRKLIRNAEACNGWRNQETWTVHLWVTNEQATYDHARIICRIAKGKDDHKYAAADRLRDYCDSLVPSRIQGTMFVDLLNCAFARCDWLQVAAAMREE